MSALYNMHLEKNVKMGVYNGKSVPSSYNAPDVTYKAARENAVLVDYSHMSIVSVVGEDAWSLVNHMASADISIIRDEQGIYTLILNEDGSVWGDAYVLCTDEGYFILSESLSCSEIIERLNCILENGQDLDIQETPEISSMDAKEWGAILLEGPYAWELLSEIYGFDIVGLPYHEYMNTDDGLITFRCGKHGEFAYLLAGEQQQLVEVWNQLLDKGEKYQLKTGGLDYQDVLRVENPCWDASVYQNYSRNPVELQLQWAVQYDKEDFIGKSAVEGLSSAGAARKLVGIVPLTDCNGITADDKVLVDGAEVGVIVKGVYSPAMQSYIALALIDSQYAWSDIAGFDIQTRKGDVAAKTHNVPFLYNFSMLVNPTEHSYIDASKPKSAL
ncbi:aminomethyltransferase family protein [Winslowiella toletana]|uniref:aminomethyltransferase family protein n=1 Tax=Winslowiella toletana TaxID=92490 RepID=UPI0028BD945C|nr:aminomethyltransferase family protein [Winslowiella toletana]WNN45944.1 aminomethyltransferase family protein [Winslowiella toletana]